MLKIYSHPRCSTCKSILKLFNDSNIDYELIDLTIHNISIENIELYHNISQLPINKFFNTSGMVYRELGLKDVIKTITLEEAYKYLSSDGMLVKRPLITDGINVTLGKKDIDKWM